MSLIPDTKPEAQKALEARFRELAEKWLADTRHLSSTTATVAHPAFQEIVAMGEPAIPLVLREMEKQTGHWDLALGEITGERPFPPADVGKIRRIEEAWLRWAREKGYQW